MVQKIFPIVLVLFLIFSCKNDQKPPEDDINSSKTVVSTPETVINTQNVSSTTSTSTNSDFTQEVQNFVICKKAAIERNDCRNSITKIISKTFDLTEFSDPELGYVVFDSIHPIVQKSKKWLQLGVINQESINQALAHTNRGGLSLIIDTSHDYGHVVMMVPGESKKSGSWDMKLPNVLSLSNHKPEKSFSDKSLSYAMIKSEDLKIFVRQ